MLVCFANSRCTDLSGHASGKIDPHGRMNSNRWFLKCALAVLLVLGLSTPIPAQTPPLNGVWVYTLVNGSQLTEDCPVCDRITLPVPMRGTFQLRFLGEGPFFAN